MFGKTIAICGGTIAAVSVMVPLWKSAVLSPDSIMRRCFWFGGALLVIAVLTVPSAWPGRIFGAVAMLLGLTTIALRCRHIKIGERVITVMPLDEPRPDRPPALSPQREESER